MWRMLRICSNLLLYIFPVLDDFVVRNLLKTSPIMIIKYNSIMCSFLEMVGIKYNSHACFWRVVNTTLFMFFTGINIWCCRYLGSIGHCSHSLKLNISSVTGDSLLTDRQIASPGLFFILWPEGMDCYLLFLCFSLFPFPFSLFVAMFVVLHNLMTRWAYVYKL